MKEVNLEQQNDWAFDIYDKPIHIANAESGLKGYYCMGCKKEMQAVKPTKYQSYFRHHAFNVDKKSTECVYSSREYRERLAEQILHNLKELKLPAVIKYPPKDVDGDPIILKERSICVAAKVKSQLSFYEDEDGNIKYGKNPDIEDRFLLIRPDVTFFDIHDKPILFVEFVITHKVDDEKKAKLRRLGIDTVQIIIPKVPQEEIEASLKSVSKIKWVYNELEANTTYLSISEGNPERVSSIDEQQRKFFEESATCRTAQINNLIRSISRNLESQQYRRTIRLFEQEISRIARASGERRTRLEELERSYESEVYREFEHSQFELEQRYQEFREEEMAFTEKYSNLERRYIKKDRELRESTELLSKNIRNILNSGAIETGIRGEFDAKRDRIRRDIERERAYVEMLRRKEGDFGEQFERFGREIHEEFLEQERREQENLESSVREIEERREQIETEINSLEESFGEEERRSISEVEAIEREFIERIRNEDASGNSELSERINSILGVRGFLRNFTERKSTCDRYRAHLELVRKGAWKSW
ncbi:hypothetical protein E0W68_06105 [Flavobacterium salilacus subsp. salilacus]|uniref:hypothetical protein n=1 Tax=Flavobacterium TaxID=237 RepID=UPI001074BBF2|nr:MULTISPECIES: hypothetical protein [Flavobacterium]KAF2518826.1 hypothetical protein E0W68_06105 [Flavobacterium salilacus subsp. salilacus]MBE1615015.1 hypothetical protein [Flavobacterium sp. SaA2.13]